MSGKFEIVENKIDLLKIKVSIRMITGEAKLGNATFRFEYNDSCLAIQNDSIATKILTEYFPNSEYYRPSITLPMQGIISLNVASKSANAINLTQNYRDIALLIFKKKSRCNNYNFCWVKVELFSPSSSIPVANDQWQNLMIYNRKKEELQIK